MGESTEISWTDATHNSWWGCQKVSDGCKHCYADTFAKRVGHGKRLPVIWGGDETERRIASEKVWGDPVKWNADAAARGVRLRVFAHSMSDVAEDRPDLVAPRARLARLVEVTPNLDWQFLTKRPENYVPLFRAAGWETWPSNVWAGTTAEHQKAYDERWPHLARVPAIRRFISYEPALGPLTLICNGCGHDTRAHLAPDQGGCPSWFPDWVIVGGESGAGARPFDLAWMRSVIHQCRATRVKVFCKQLGAVPLVGAAGDAHERHIRMWTSPTTLEERIVLKLADGKGGDMSEWPDDLRVREFPR